MHVRSHISKIVFINRLVIGRERVVSYARIVMQIISKVRFVENYAQNVKRERVRAGQYEMLHYNYTLCIVAIYRARRQEGEGLLVIFIANKRPVVPRLCIFMTMFCSFSRYRRFSLARIISQLATSRPCLF